MYQGYKPLKISKNDNTLLFYQKRKNIQLKDRYRVEARMPIAKCKRTKRSWTKIQDKKGIDKNKRGITLPFIHNIY